MESLEAETRNEGRARSQAAAAEAGEPMRTQQEEGAGTAPERGGGVGCTGRGSPRWSRRVWHMW